MPTKFPVTFLTESTNHIWCNRHLFSLKQHIPSANGLCLTQKYHYLPSGSLQIETCWLSFRSGAIAYRSLSLERSWRHCPAAHLWVRRSCVLGILYSVVPHFLREVYYNTEHKFCQQKFFKIFFAHVFPWFYAVLRRFLCFKKQGENLPDRVNISP